MPAECGNCRWLRERHLYRDESVNPPLVIPVGNCRRGLPQVTVQGGSTWPTVKFIGWCYYHRWSLGGRLRWIGSLFT